MKIKITHDTGLVIRLDVPAKSVDAWMAAFSKFVPGVVAAGPGIFQSAQERAAAEAALKEQEEHLAAARKTYEEAIAADKAAAAAQQKRKAKRKPRPKV